MTSRTPPERHRMQRIGWLRAAVLGANDGIISTGSLMIGVAVAGIGLDKVLLTGVAGLVSGAMSMAAGEYVSIHAQADTETADLARERAELASDPVAEQRELAALYMARGVAKDLAREVAAQLMARDALAAHAHDELGISDVSHARPVQAALVSAGSFALGSAVPLIVMWIAPSRFVIPSALLASLCGLIVLGAAAARIGGSSAGVAVLRVTLWGMFAIAVTAVAGALFGAG